MLHFEKNNYKEDVELLIANLLCSSGYLPPRNEDDLKRFDLIYKEKVFDVENYVVDADGIFDRVIHDSPMMKKLTKSSTIFDNPGALRVADGINSSADDFVGDIINKLKNGKKD